MTTSTTRRETKSSDYEDSLAAVYSYKSHITPRSTTISRRNAGPNRTIVQTVYSSSSGGYQGNQGNFLYGGGVPLKPKNAAVVAIAEGREKEKRELSQLNDKFASYVERVRFLEVHNKKLQMELEALKNRAGGESGKIREMYEIELREAKHLIDETSKDKANAELKARTCEEDAERFRKRYADVLNNRNADKARIDELNKQIADNEAEINLLKRRLGDLEDEAKRYKIETQRLLGTFSSHLCAHLPNHRVRLIKYSYDLFYQFRHQSLKHLKFITHNGPSVVRKAISCITLFDLISARTIYL